MKYIIAIFAALIVSSCNRPVQYAEYNPPIPPGVTPESDKNLECNVSTFCEPNEQCIIPCASGDGDYTVRVCKNGKWAAWTNCKQWNEHDKGIDFSKTY